jgi:hypothetical protein
MNGRQRSRCTGLKQAVARSERALSLYFTSWRECTSVLEQWCSEPSFTSSLRVARVAGISVASGCAAKTASLSVDLCSLPCTLRFALDSAFMPYVHIRGARAR